MTKTYTAQEMREKASFFDRNAGQFSKARSNSVLAEIPEAIAMLRQAADALEREEKREKKYEYAMRMISGMPSSIHDEKFSSVLHSYRREVGEWEEVRDGE